MKKSTKVIIGIITTALLGFILFIVFSFYGNPVSWYLTSKNAEKYISENYTNTDYVVSNVYYNFKTGGYYAYIESPSSPDSYFSLSAGLNGKITFDTYESAVLGKWNTASRISTEYFNKTSGILSRDDFPYNQHIAYGEIYFVESGTPVGEDIPDYALSTADLVLDKAYDIKKLGAKSGKLTVYIYDEDISVERLAEILLGIKQFLNDNGVTFYAIDCVLEYPKPEDENAPWKEGRTEVMNFLCEDIYEEGLVERVRDSDEKAKEYWAQQDKLLEEKPIS